MKDATRKGPISPGIADTLAEWEATPRILLPGQFGYVIDHPGCFKIGDGVTRWKDLPMLDSAALSNAGSGGGDGGGDGGGGTVETITGKWQFSSNAGQNPGGSQFATDTGDTKTAAMLKIAVRDADYTDFAYFLSRLVDGDQIDIAEIADPSYSVTYLVVPGVTTPGQWVDVPVAMQSFTKTGPRDWSQCEITMPVHSAVRTTLT